MGLGIVEAYGFLSETVGPFFVVCPFSLAITGLLLTAFKS